MEKARPYFCLCILTGMQPAEYKYSRLRMGYVIGVLAPLALAFAVLAVTAAWKERPFPTGTVVGLLIVDVLLVLVLRLIVRKLLDRSPRLTLNDDGVLDCNLPTPLIPWAAIESAEIVRLYVFAYIPQCTVIRLQLSDEQERLQRLSAKERKQAQNKENIGLGYFQLDITNLAVGAKKLLAAMNEHRLHVGLPTFAVGAAINAYRETMDGTRKAKISG